MESKEEDKATTAEPFDTNKEQPSKAPEEVHKEVNENMKHKEHVHDHNCRHDHSLGEQFKEFPGEYFFISL
jgi:hypothetical protein